MNSTEYKRHKDYSTLSRYSNFPYYYDSVNNKYYHGITAYLKDTTIFTNYIVEQGDTLDNLALKFYNNPTYYWIICSFNHIQNPYKPLIAGSILKIPSISNIEFDTNKRF